jgi:hypothetical protein
MRLFHQNVDPMAVLLDGFAHVRHRYGAVRSPGVRLSTGAIRADANFGLLEVHLPAQLANDYEVRSRDPRCRAFVIPAAVLRKFGPLRVLTADEADAAGALLDTAGSLPTVRTMPSRRWRIRGVGPGTPPPGRQ